MQSGSEALLPGKIKFSPTMDSHEGVHARSRSQVEHMSDLFREGEKRRQRRRLQCIGFGRMLATRATPCRCSGDDKGTYVWHNYKPLKEKLEEIIESVVQEFVDKESVVVAAAYSMERFLEQRGAPLCRDQFLRLVVASLCVNAKYWDEGAASANLNCRIAGRACVALEDFNRMEIALMRGLDWNLGMSAEQFEEWSARLETLGAQACKEQENLRRNQSPLLSTDLAERLSVATEMGSATPVTWSDTNKCSFDQSLVSTVLRVSSTATDSKGDVITSRLVFPSLPPVDSSGKFVRISSADTILRVGSLSLGLDEQESQGEGGGTTILRTVSMQVGAT